MWSLSKPFHSVIKEFSGLEKNSRQHLLCSGLVILRITLGLEIFECWFWNSLKNLTTFTHKCVWEYPSMTLTMYLRVYCFFLLFSEGLVHLPHLYASFQDSQYKSVFAISLPYTDPFKWECVKFSIKSQYSSMFPFLTFTLHFFFNTQIFSVHHNACLSRDCCVVYSITCGVSQSICGIRE